MRSEHCATLSSSATWPSTISRVARTYHVLCSLHPETLHSVFLTYDHGYPGCLDPTLTSEALPPRARSRAKLAIFDACDTALAGTHHPAVQHLRQLIVEMGSAPQARIIGERLRTSMLDAAWLT